MASHHGMPMLDIKCQSPQSDAGWGSSATVPARRGYDRGLHCDNTPGESLCGDNTSLIEFRVGELTLHIWVKAKMLLARKRKRRREKEDDDGANWRVVFPNVNCIICG